MGRTIEHMTHNHPKEETNFSFGGDGRRLWSNNLDLKIGILTTNIIVNLVGKINILTVLIQKKIYLT